MTLKKLAILGGVLAGAAYLQNKGRRDRAFTGARDMFDKVKSRAQEVGHQAQAKIDSVRGTEKTEKKDPSFASTTTSGLGSSGMGNSGSSYGSGLGTPPNYR